MVKTLLRNSLVLAVCFYLSIFFLPEVLHINETISKYLVVIPVILWIIESKNRWLVNMGSIVLGFLEVGIAFIIFEIIRDIL